jgi:cytochrome bd-type quinol oxidase subunit 2
LKIKWQIVGYILSFLWAAMIYPTVFFSIVTDVFDSKCGNIAGSLMLVNLIFGVPFTLLFQALAFAKFPIEVANPESIVQND